MATLQNQENFVVTKAPSSQQLDGTTDRNGALSLAAAVSAESESARVGAEQRTAISGSTAATLVLAKFQQSPWLEFGEVAVGQVRALNVRVQLPDGASGSDPVEVEIDPEPRTLGLEIEPMTFSVSPASPVALTLTWTPVADGNVRENIYFTVEGRRRCAQMVVLGTAVPAAAAPRKFKARKLNRSILEGVVGVPSKGAKAKSAVVRRPLGTSSNVMDDTAAPAAAAASSGVASAGSENENEAEAKQKSSSKPAKNKSGGGFKARRLNPAILHGTVGVPEKKKKRAHKKNKKKGLGRAESRRATLATSAPYSSSGVGDDFHGDAAASSSSSLSLSLKLRHRNSTIAQAGAIATATARGKIAARGRSRSKSSSGTSGSMGMAATSELYDDKWVEKQEAGFTHWVNYTFYPPEDALVEGEESATEGSKEKESSSSSSSSSSSTGGRPTPWQHHFTSLLQRRRMSRVRRAAFALYHSEEVDALLFNLDKEIADGRLAIRSDRNVFQVSVLVCLIDCLFDCSLGLPSFP